MFTHASNVALIRGLRGLEMEKNGRLEERNERGTEKVVSSSKCCELEPLIRVAFLFIFYVLQHSLSYRIFFPVFVAMFAC